MGRSPEPTPFPLETHDDGACPAPAGVGALRALSVSHRTAPLDVLERLALAPHAVSGLYGELRRLGAEAAILSTCNRTEIYWCSRGAADAEVETRVHASCEDARLALGRFARLSGVAVAEHLFRVAAGLDSLIVGEAEVLAQVRDALDSATRHGTAGDRLAGLFRAALRCGGRARQETGIGTGALSVASAAVALLAERHPDLTRRTVLVLGAGGTGLKAARHLQAERVGRLVLLNRTRARAEQAAREIGCESAPLDALPDWLPRADALVAALQAEAPVVTAAGMRAAAARRSASTCVLLDVALPRAIEPACARIPGVELHDLSGLERIVELNRARRRREIPRVESLIASELRFYQARSHESSLRPVLSELRHLAERIRVAEIERARSEGVPADELLERVTRRIVDRLLHGPSMALRRGDLPLDGAHAHQVRRMLGLAGGAPDPTGDPRGGSGDAD